MKNYIAKKQTKKKMISIIDILLFLLLSIVVNSKTNDFESITSFIEQQITLTCTINLDQRNFSTSGDYKVTLCFKILLFF
jgi:hypothetical protein